MEPQSSPPRKGKGHRSSCACILCTRIKARIAAGLPTREEERAQRRAARLAKQSMTKPQPHTQRERRIATDSALSSAIAAQIALGQKPNATMAAKIAGVGPSTASERTRTENMRSSIEAALARVGITDDKLAEVAAGGLEAEFVKHIIQDGQVVGETRNEDWRNRHAFWRDLAMIKGYLGSDRDVSTCAGGLMIITGPVRVNTGHSSACQCDECVRAWEDSARKILEAQRKLEHRELESRGLLIEAAPTDDAPAEMPAEENEDEEKSD